jgi:acetyl esterase/lipase
MKPFLISLLVLFALNPLFAQTRPTIWQPSPSHTQIPIWPGTPPDAKTQAVTAPESVITSDGTIAGKPVLLVTNVTKPTMTIYSPTRKNTGAAIIVCPGGGYRCLAIDLEGTEICDWLTSKGLTAVLLKYRAPTPRHGEYSESRMALQDAQRTLSLLRHRAAQWNIDPHKIGIIGFSAGGHMVTATSTHFATRSYTPIDEADTESCRPDFGLALYPGHMSGEKVGSMDFTINPDITVTSNTPPQFIMQAENDPVDSVNNSLVYYIALKNAGVPAELHLYAEGGHAWGLRPTKYPVSHWPHLAETWLQTIGIISK